MENILPYIAIGTWTLIPYVCLFILEIERRSLTHHKKCLEVKVRRLENQLEQTNDREKEYKGIEAI